MCAVGDEALKPRFGFRHGIGARYAQAIEAVRAGLFRNQRLEFGGIGQKSRSA